MSLPLSVEQVALLKDATRGEVVAVGIARSRLWDTAMTCLRLCGRLDDDELTDVIWTAAEQLQFRVGGEKAFQACEEAVREINAIPGEYSAEDQWSA